MKTFAIQTLPSGAGPMRAIALIQALASGIAVGLLAFITLPLLRTNVPLFTLPLLAGYLWHFFCQQKMAAAISGHSYLVYRLSLITLILGLVLTIASCGILLYMNTLGLFDCGDACTSSVATARLTAQLVIVASGLAAIALSAIPYIYFRFSESAKAAFITEARL